MKFCVHLDPAVSELYVGPPDSQDQLSIRLRRRLGFVHPAGEIGHDVAALVAYPLIPVGVDYSRCSSRWWREGGYGGTGV